MNAAGIDVSKGPALPVGAPSPLSLVLTPAPISLETISPRVYAHLFFRPTLRWWPCFCALFYLLIFLLFFQISS